jgi:hypothetical protein
MTAICEFLEKPKLSLGLLSDFWDLAGDPAVDAAVLPHDT